MRNIGTKRQFFFNHALLDAQKTTATIKVGDKPIRREKVMSFEEEWESYRISYPTFFYDEDIQKYRMYYCASHRIHEDSLNAKEMDEPDMRFCYAESEDGIHWVKPNLGIIEVNGDRNNNVIIDKTSGNTFDNFFAFKDTNPNCPPDERYKGVAYDTRGPETKRRSGMDSNRVLLYFKSADGIHFDPVGEILDLEGRFDTHNTVFWDPEDELYHIFFRDLTVGYCYPDIEQKVWVRLVCHSTSKDFRNWTYPEDIRYQEGAPTVQMYTPGIMPYYRGDGLWIGIPTRYFEYPTWLPNHEHMPANKERRQLLDVMSRCATAITDCGFMYSENKSDWYRFDEALMTPGPENQDNWFYGCCYPAVGMMENVNEFGEKELALLMPMYTWNREKGFLNKHTNLYRYTMRVDGFACAHADYNGGEVVTKPFTFEGSKLEMNFRTSAGGYIEVTLTDAQGNALEGFTNARIFGDSLERPVDFTGDLTTLNGKEVCLKLKLSDADAFSFKFC